MGKLDCFGTIRFIGSAAFKPGKSNWYGIELETSKGKSNGTEQSRIYFSCKPKHGLFAKANEFEALKYTVTKKKKKSKKTIIKSSETEKRQEMEVGINALLQSCEGNGLQNSFDELLKSYDDKKESEDMKWLQIIAKLKAINDDIIQLKNQQHSVNNNKNEQALKEEIEQLNEAKIELEKALNDVKSSNDEKYEREINKLKDSKFSLQEEVNNLKYNGNAAKYSIEIKQLNTDKMNLENQVKSLQNSSKSESLSVADNEIVNELKKEQEQTRIILRAKDEIINNAKEEIAKLKEELS